MSWQSINSTIVNCACVVIALGLGIGCHRDMRDQPRYDTLEASDFFENGQSARPPVEGTVAYGSLARPESYNVGKADGQYLPEPPMELSRKVLERGQERFNIFCSACHAKTGNGDGMVVQRGMRRPPSLHDARLRNVPAGHIYDVITNGFGAMPSYKVQLTPDDRWAVVAYVRVLQMSQNAKIEDVPPEEQATLEEVAP